MMDPRPRSIGLRRLRPCRIHPRVAALAVLGMLVASAAPTARAQAPDRATLGAQAQAAYLAGDAAAIGRLEATARPWAKSTDPLELYTYAFVQFRAQQLAIAAKREGPSKAAGEACVAAAEAAVKADPKSADALALQSACYGYLANLGGMAAIRNGSRSGKSMEAALALQPRNPRVMLVDGFGYYFRPKFVGGDTGKGCARFREAAAAFDAGAGGRGGAGGIDWGAAEAHLWVGRCARDAGDAAAARKAFERALALAPDFVAAKRALGR
jgi:tetratricopeptide (TPR) repeat protein